MAAGVSCSSCGRANRAESRFCVGCGKALVPRCPTCGAETEHDARFCGACGSPLAAPGQAVGAEVRKVVTVVFADLIGSTSLHERLDAESTRRLMDHYYRALRVAVEEHGGTVVKLLGDGVMAAFGVPRVSEDDAIRAVRAAVEMQHAFRDLAREQSGLDAGLGLRVAVNTGEVVVSAGNDDVVGDPVNVAARLQQEAPDGEVLIGESTRRLVNDLVTLAPYGMLALKGRSETVEAHRVVSLERPPSAAATAFVGRDEELRRLTAVYEAAVGARAARLAVVLGSPGLGKSRLVEELARRLGSGATLLGAQCNATAGATFAPVAEALRALLDLDEGDRENALRGAVAAQIRDVAEAARIADGIGALLAGTPAAPEETFYVVRRLLAALAEARPVVLVLDDAQWAEPLLLDLVEHLVQWSTDVPLLVLVAARPELHEMRASLVTAGGLVSDVVTLAGLDAGAATRLAANVIGSEALPAALAGRVLATSEGNPLFVGELVRMLVQDGVLKREGDRWTTGVELASLEMPPTIHALLAARIERLRPEDCAVLERAAVIGRQFTRAALEHLLPEGITDLDARLESLRRGELIEDDAAWFLGEPLLRFHHVLTRDAAYRRLLKGTRAELHGRFAAWLEARAGGSVEHDETIGWHFEQAHQHLRELGPVDAAGRAFGERAAHYLAAAGRRALLRDDLPRAANLLRRALDRFGALGPARAEMVLDCCESLLAGGDVGPAAAAIADLDDCIDAAASPDRVRLQAWRTCFAGQLAVLTDPQALHDTAGLVAKAAEDLAQTGDAVGEAKAHSVHALALARLGKIGASEAALDRALAAARQAKDRRRANAVLAGSPLAALWGPSPVARASGRCLDVVRVLRITQGAPAVEAVALRCQAVLEALRGRADAARRMIASSRDMVEELGITQRLLEADVSAGLIELLQGDAAAAERRLRGAYEGLRALGLGIDAAQAAALLGRALLAQDRVAEAEELTHASEALAGDDLKAAIAWRCVRAEALARRGEHGEAVDLARAAVDIAAMTDALLDHADARLALAAALSAADREEEARAEEARAIELWDAKGATLLAERARRVASPAPAVVAPQAAGAERQLRRVRANDAIANALRLDAALAARDVAGCDDLLSDPSESVHHPTGAAYGRRGALSAFQGLLRAQNTSFEEVPLATLGQSLALCRVSVSFDALAEGDLGPFGAVSKEEIILIEVDADGRRTRAEFFLVEHLGQAIARLYERHAERLRGRPGGESAAATARSVAAILGPFDVARYSTAVRPDVEFADHRIVGFPSGRGADELLKMVGSLAEASDSAATRVDDILALEANAFLVRWTTLGTDRLSGGAFEWQFLRLCLFGDDGLLVRAEQFDVDRGSEALRRFDDNLAGSVGSECADGEAAETRERLTRAFSVAFAKRDWEALAALLAEDVAVTDHRLLGWESLHGPRAYVDALRSLVELAPDVELAIGHLAMSGRRFLYVTTWRGTRDGGHFESPSAIVCELDAHDRIRRMDQFDLDHLDEARALLEGSSRG